MAGLPDRQPSIVQTPRIVEDNLNNFLTTLCYIVMRLQGYHFTYYMREHLFIRQTPGLLS